MAGLQTLFNQKRQGYIFLDFVVWGLVPCSWGNFFFCFFVLPPFHNSLEFFCMKPQGMLNWKPKCCPPYSGYVKNKLGKVRVAHADGTWNIYYSKLNSAPSRKKERSLFQVLFLAVLSMSPEAHRPVGLGSWHSHSQRWGPLSQWPGLTRNELRMPQSEMMKVRERGSLRGAPIFFF